MIKKELVPSATTHIKYVIKLGLYIDRIAYFILEFFIPLLVYILYTNTMEENYN